VVGDLGILEQRIALRHGLVNLALFFVEPTVAGIRQQRRSDLLEVRTIERKIRSS
jgi:hypothetical protein